MAKKGPINNADAAALERAARERAMDEANRSRIAANLKARVAELESDAREKLKVLIRAGKLDKPAARLLLWRRFDPKVKNAQEKFDKAIVAAGMSPAERSEARGGAAHIGATVRKTKSQRGFVSNARKSTTPAKGAAIEKARRVEMGLPVRKKAMFGMTFEEAAAVAAEKVKRVKRSSRLARKGPKIVNKILGRGPWTVLGAKSVWEPPLTREGGRRPKKSYKKAFLTGATYRRVGLPKPGAKVSADMATYVAQEVGAVAIKRKFKSTFQGKPSAYGGESFAKQLVVMRSPEFKEYMKLKHQKISRLTPELRKRRQVLAEMFKGVRTAKFFQAEDITKQLAGKWVTLPSGDVSSVNRVIPILGGRNAGKILVVHGEGTTMITPELTKWGRKPLLPFMHKASWTRRMRVVMPKTNEDWLEPGEMTPGQAVVVLDRMIDSISPGKGGRIATFGGVDVTERPGYSMFKEIGEKAVVAVQDAIRKRKYGWTLSPRTVAYRAKMASGGQMYTEGKFGKNRRTWHDFPARKAGDPFPINRPSGKQITVEASPDHPLLWTGTLVNSVESFVDYDERSVSYGVFHSNNARHPVDGKMMYDIARYLLKKFNFLGHHVVREAIIDSTRDVMIDYFNKIIHGGMDIQMRGRPGSKLAMKPKIGTIVADPRHLEAYGRLRKEPLGEMEPMSHDINKRIAPKDLPKPKQSFKEWKK